jgi:Mu-like prophage protein gp36
MTSSSYLSPFGILGSYADQEDLRDIGMTDLFFTGDLAPDEKSIIKALVNASSFADGYLAANGSLSLPLTPPYDPSLVEAVCKIAAYKLLAHRGYDPDTVDKSLKTDRDDAVKWLVQVQENRVVLTRQLKRPNPLGQQPCMIGNRPRGLRNWSGRVGNGGR